MNKEKLIKDYAHDYRDIRMDASNLELMLTRFLKDIEKVNHPVQEDEKIKNHIHSFSYRYGYKESCYCGETKPTDHEYLKSLAGKWFHSSSIPGVWTNVEVINSHDNRIRIRRCWYSIQEFKDEFEEV